MQFRVISDILLKWIVLSITIIFSEHEVKFIVTCGFMEKDLCTEKSVNFSSQLS